MKTALAILGIGALIAGCSAGSESASASHADLEAASQWVVFANRADAVSWWNDRGHEYVVSIQDDYPAFADDAPETLRVQALVDAHWQTIRSLYAIDLPPPVAIVNHSSSDNAFTVFDKQASKTANAITVNAGALGRSEARLSAVIAHELGHVVLRNVDPQRAPTLAHYYHAGTPEPLGILQSDEPDVRRRVTAWARDIANIGSPTLPEELDGYPALSIFEYALDALYEEYGHHGTPECHEYRQMTSAVGAIVQTAWTDHRAVTADEKATIASSVQTIESSTCIETPAGVTIEEKLAWIIGVPAGDLATRLAPEDFAIAHEKPALEALFTITRNGRRRIHELAAAPDFASLRWWSQEEQADDFAMTVLFHEGNDPVDVGRWAVGLAAPDAETACAATLASGTTPAYGLDEPHHDPCYRLFHAQQLTAWLAGGGKGVVLPP